MDQGPWVREETDEGAKLAREFDRFAPVKVAFWLKASDEEQRSLYLASQIDDTNFDLAYREVARLTNQFPPAYLDPCRVKVIGGKHPLAQAAVDINRRFPGPMPSRFGGTSFGGITVDDVYIYPSPRPVAAP
jgi:hypothetical protein